MQPSVSGLTDRGEAASTGGVNRTATWLLNWEGRFAAQNALPHSGLASIRYPKLLIATPNSATLEETMSRCLISFFALVCLMGAGCAAINLKGIEQLNEVMGEITSVVYESLSKSK